MHPTPGMENQDHRSWRELVETWRAASLGAGWRHTGDWDLAPVESIAQQLLTDARLSSESSASLGAARAWAGAGAREVLLDLKALYATLGQEMDLDATACAIDAWAETSHDTAELGCLDVATGLYTPSHFRHTVREMLSAGSGPVLVTSFALRHNCAATPLSWTLLAELGDAVSRTLGQGVCAAHISGTVAVACRDDEDSLRRLQECRTALETLRDGALLPVDVTQEEASVSSLAGAPGISLRKIPGITSRFES
ncbi:hypothetical protein [Arthrobacter sp. RAF14]|uniref:hypothetical protein n=1 Tax=Arthrobacter sp. RAF14 TaxID=3233051 RepID=UPI003F8EA9F7